MSGTLNPYDSQTIMQRRWMWRTRISAADLTALMRFTKPFLISSSQKTSKIRMAIR